MSSAGQVPGITRIDLRRAALSARAPNSVGNSATAARGSSPTRIVEKGKSFLGAGE